MSERNNKKNKPPEFRPKDQSKVTLEYFSTAKVAMLTEVNRHPVLVAQLVELRENDPNSGWSEQLAEIAAYCNVIMDGLYSQEDLEILYPQLTKRMTDTRMMYKSGIVLPSTIH